MFRPLSLPPAPLALLAVLAASASAQAPAPGSREATWPAPTAADWARPCLITWQRTFEDARAVAQETGKPILVCINMDGEIASEHYAGIRYRQPEIAGLYEPYVCVIASVYRHTPRDYDEEGNRIPCPRFGTVTCGEHIAIEPGLYSRFMDDRRIAPRHIAVELDGQESYDVYYAFDTQSVFDTIAEGAAGRPSTLNPVVRGDRPIVERVASRDVQDRMAVEQAFRAGDARLRRDLIQAASDAVDHDQTELLRLGVMSLDPELAGAARQALARTSSEKSVDLVLEALRSPADEDERTALVGALERIGSESPRARTLARVQQGLAAGSTAIDLERWLAALETDPSAFAAESAVATHEARAAAQREVLAGADPAAHLDLAEAFLFLALHRESDPELRRLLFLDSENALAAAERLGASGWRTGALRSEYRRERGDRDEARRLATAAVAALPAGEPRFTATTALAIFARACWQELAAALRRKAEWDPGALADVHAAYSILGRHPLGNPVQAVAHHDILRWLGADGPAGDVLERALARFPESFDVHDRLRSVVLRDRGADGLEPRYRELLQRDDGAVMEWYAGYAALVAAEFQRRAGRAEAAAAAYDRGMEHFARAKALDDTTSASADHYAALALAGRARLALERGDTGAALDEILASFARYPEAAGTLDGLNLTPVDTARMLLARLRQQGQDAEVARLQSALDDLDPALLELPAYEREAPPAGAGGGPPRRRRPEGSNG